LAEAKKKEKAHYLLKSKNTIPMQKLRKIVAFMAIVSLVAVNGFVSTAYAASLSNVSDRVSDSDVSVTAVHTITFTTHGSLAIGERFEVDLTNIGTSTSPTCPTNMTGSLFNFKTIRCQADALIATGTYTMVTTSTNPSTVGSYLVPVHSKTAGGTVIESANAMVAIVDNVDVSATVASTLTFEIRPVPTNTLVNGASTTAASATTSLAFGTLQVGTSSIMAQELRVTTNADSGYTVTVEQDQNLTSAGGSDIDAFKDGATSTPQTWAAPIPALDSEQTYGHFGFTTNDASGGGTQDYTGGKWRGLDSNTPVAVMYHNGPADGSTQDKGMAQVAYRIQISALQEAGDYTNALTYIATPIY
jgi:hypothetical protein